MDIFEYYSQLGFAQRLVINSFFIMALVIILSIYNYKKKGERTAILFRHIAGLIVGITDQALMIIYGWQDIWVGEFLIWVYSVYTLFLFLIPDFIEYERRKKYIFLVVWILLIGTVFTIIENIGWYAELGYLPYPTEPIVWTIPHTWLFYVGVYTEGTIIVYIGLKLDIKKE